MKVAVLSLRHASRGLAMRCWVSPCQRLYFMSTKETEYDVTFTGTKFCVPIFGGFCFMLRVT